jgi:uncharacterized protein YuzE
MEVRIDPEADAVKIEWGTKPGVRSRAVGDPAGGGVVLDEDEDGNVVGVEVLFWSHRTATALDVRVVVADPAAGETLTLSDDHPLARALAAGRATAAAEAGGRPLHRGAPMLPLGEAAARLGRDRSWLAREVARGRLKSVRVGRQWWTTPEWVDAYAAARRPPPGRRRAPASGRAAASPVGESR